MVLDPVKDDALGPRHCLLVLVVIIGVDWDSYYLEGEVLDTISVKYRKDSGLPDCEVRCSVQSILVSYSM